MHMIFILILRRLEQIREFGLQADPSDSQHFNGVGLNIPTVLILIGGDFDTFERAANAVEKEIPIILCEGSGLATDIIASGIRVSQKSADFKLSKEQEQVLVKLMETQLRSVNNQIKKKKLETIIK